MMNDEWRRLWAEMTDEELEYRLFTYFWLAMKTPNSQSNRLRELVDEAEKRRPGGHGGAGQNCLPQTSATCSDDENESRGQWSMRRTVRFF
jgi:hypothetical protein